MLVRRAFGVSTHSTTFELGRRMVISQPLGGRMAAVAAVLLVFGCARESGGPQMSASSDLGLPASLDLKAQPGIVALGMSKGQLSYNGASQWYTTALSLGESRIKINFDTGANFVWATSTLCTTTACDAHEKVDTSQAGYEIVDSAQCKRSFGPWGDMYTETGQVDFIFDETIWTEKLSSIRHFAATKFTGSKFEYLAWDGGASMPSTFDPNPGTPTCTPQSGDHPWSSYLMLELLNQGVIDAPGLLYSTGQYVGSVVLGDFDTSGLRSLPHVTLPDNNATKDPGLGYLWGTKLASLSIGGQAVSALTGQNFYLDTGSSHFKGDNTYLDPILDAFAALTDGSGTPIFTEIDEDGVRVGLAYRNGTNPNDYPGLLPDITLVMGESCNDVMGASAAVTLSADQYSYRVETGDEQVGSWVLGFKVLNGVGGLLVGSLFMDGFITEFEFAASSEPNSGGYVQGPMTLYAGGTDLPNPPNFTCVSQ